MFIPAIFLLGIGFGAAIILSVASKVFYVWEDPKIVEVEENLLGANCGGCGYAGCHSAAVAVAGGKASADVCVAGGADVAAAVAAVLGVAIELKEPEVSSITCRYSVEKADTKFTYSGQEDCRAAMQMAGGSKVCSIGCLGLGSCVKACPFGAIKMGRNGLPVILKNKCRACGICIEICPKNILHLTSNSLRMTGENRYDECTTPCQRTCPTGIDIQAYIKEIKKGNYREALRIIKEKNPLPSICGRICPAPCEVECRRNFVDEPVAINHLKRFVADFEMSNGTRIHPYTGQKTGKRIAVIGGGAQGLTSAYYLGCLGHDVKIFEAKNRLGGIIRNVISRTRLPGNAFDWDIDGIIDIGISVETGRVIGPDIGIDSLLHEYNFDAVSIASGGLESRRVLENPATENIIPGVFLFLDFLTSVKDNREISVGEKVFIFGGGNTAAEIASICSKKGAKEMYIIYPYAEQELKNRDIKPVTGNNVKITCSSVINKIKGNCKALQYITLKNTETGASEEKEANTLIIAAGSLSDMVLVKEKDNAGEALMGSWQSLDTYKIFSDTNEDIFNISIASRVNDNLAVVKSINRGRMTARAVHQYLSGRDIMREENAITDNSAVLNTRDINNVNNSLRQLMPINPAALQFNESDRFYSEIEEFTGFTEDLARTEAERCLECGLICYQKSA